MKKYEIKNLFRTNTSLLYIAMSMIGKEKKNCLPELFYTMSHEDVYKIVTLLGGREIYIPNPEEFRFFLTCSMAVYYLRCQKQGWREIKRFLDLDEKEYKKVRKKVDSWLENSTKEELEMLKKLREPAGRLDI
jgi:hypothetical protein